jgi:hypothetical protein
MCSCFLVLLFSCLRVFLPSCLITGICSFVRVFVSFVRSFYSSVCSSVSFFRPFVCFLFLFLFWC